MAKGGYLKECLEEFEIVRLTANVTGSAGANAINVFKVTKSVQVIEQFAEITEITSLTDCTDVHADVWDGTNSVLLTKATGATLSNVPVGSFFTKLGDNTQEYTIHNATQVRSSEPTADEIGQPFIVTANATADSYIRFKFTTAGTVNFKMFVYFKWRPLDGGKLELA